VEDLHSDAANINKQTALRQKRESISGRGDSVNMHDILTGSDPQGMYSTAGGGTTCGNWTKSTADGSAIVGHHDRVGLAPSRHMNSWNSSHGSRGSSQDALKSSGGAGALLLRSKLIDANCDLLREGSARRGAAFAHDPQENAKSLLINV
jgi:hypothetical protein